MLGIACYLFFNIYEVSQYKFTITATTRNVNLLYEATPMNLTNHFNFALLPVYEGPDPQNFSEIIDEYFTMYTMMNVLNNSDK